MKLSASPAPCSENMGFSSIKTGTGLVGAELVFTPPQYVLVHNICTGQIEDIVYYLLVALYILPFIMSLQ